MKTINYYNNAPLLGLFFILFFSSVFSLSVKAEHKYKSVAKELALQKLAQKFQNVIVTNTTTQKYTANSKSSSFSKTIINQFSSLDQKNIKQKAFIKNNKWVVVLKIKPKYFGKAFMLIKQLPVLVKKYSNLQKYVAKISKCKPVFITKYMYFLSYKSHILIKSVRIYFN